jgi:hypothetical protein
MLWESLNRLWIDSQEDNGEKINKATRVLIYPSQLFNTNSSRCGLISGNVRVACDMPPPPYSSIIITSLTLRVQHAMPSQCKRPLLYTLHYAWYIKYPIEGVNLCQNYVQSCSCPLFWMFPQLEPGSSVSIVSDYGLDDRAIEVRSPVGVEDFFL